jgi:putative transcriptional regulator
MSPLSKLPVDLTGTVLVASPLLMDPNFRRTILFLSSHSREEGAAGFVLNRPLDSSLDVPGEADGVDLFFGGPVHPEALVLASLQWRQPPGLVAFHTFAGDDEPLTIEPGWRQGLRAFAGYAGWSPGQLEAEIEQQSWLVLPPSKDLIASPPPQGTWFDIMRRTSPLLALLAEAPDDPSLN